MSAARGTSTCPHCAGPTSSAFRVQDRNQRLSDAWFDYQRCGRCGTCFLAPVPGDLGRYYLTDYPAYRPEAFAAAKIRERAKLDVLGLHARPGRLLEIGPASGAFASAAKDAGFAVQAIEMDPGCCDRLNRELGIPTRLSVDPVAALRPGETFDVIALWHVVEHLVDPFAVLAALAGALAPGGVLVLSTPNPRSLQFRLLGGRWVHVDAPRHLWLLPPQVVRDRLARCGLTQVAITAADPIGLELNRMGWTHSCRNLFTAPSLRYLARGAGRAIALAVSPIERTVAFGAAYTAIYRKPAEPAAR